MKYKTYSTLLSTFLSINVLVLFLTATTIESKYSRISDEDFEEMKKGCVAAVSGEALGGTSGGGLKEKLTSDKAIFAYKLCGVALLSAGFYSVGNKRGYGSGYSKGEKDTINDLKAYSGGNAPKGEQKEIHGATVEKGVGTGWIGFPSTWNAPGVK